MSDNVTFSGPVRFGTEATFADQPDVTYTVTKIGSYNSFDEARPYAILTAGQSVRPVRLNTAVWEEAVEFYEGQPRRPRSG